MFPLVKLILNLFSDELNFPLILKVGPSPNIRKLFSQMSAWDNELLSTPKVMAVILF